MRKPRVATAALAAAMALSSLAAADPPADTITVSLVDQDGEPMAGDLPVTAYAVVSSSADDHRVIDNLEVGHGTTDANGVAKVTLGTEQPWVDRVSADDPAVSIVFEAPGVAYEVLYQPPATSSTGRWELDSGNGFDAVVDDASGIDGAAASAASPVRADAADGGLVLRSNGDFTVWGANQFCRDRYGDLFTMQWIWTGRREPKNVPVARVFVRNRTNFRYAYDTTQRTSLGFSVKAPGESPAQGGVDYSLNHDTSAGIEEDFGKWEHVFYRLVWQYRQWRGRCMGPWGIVKPTGWRTWRGHHWAGGDNSVDAPTKVWKCNRRAHKRKHRANEVYTRNARGIRFRFGFGAAGVRLDAVQHNSEAVRQALLQRTSRTHYFSCGRGHAFVNAPQGREVKP